MTLRPLIPSISAVLTLSLASCSTVINGTSQTVTINTRPPGADITISSKRGVVFTGTAPARLDLKRSQGFFMPAKYDVTVTANGYRTGHFDIHGRLSTWYAGNLILGGLLGMLIIDPATGGMWTLTPRDLQANLMPLRASSSEAKTGNTLEVVLLKDIPQDVRKKMRPLNAAARSAQRANRS